MQSVFDSNAFNQNLFFPRSDNSPTPSNSEEIYVEVEPGIKVHVRRYINEEAECSLLYFHGNGEIVSDYNYFEEMYTALGVELIVCDYRGYGKSEGCPTLRNALQDAHQIYKYIKDHNGFKSRVGVMGRSIGSAPAIELCVHYSELQFCIIESGYADPIPLVERRGIKIDSTTAEEDALFNNSVKMVKIQCPLLIMHGEDDFLISPLEAELNYKQAGSQLKHLEILAGVGHNDMLMAPENRYFTALYEFIRALPKNE
jgi:hypothetical protein